MFCYPSESDFNVPVLRILQVARNAQNSVLYFHRFTSPSFLACPFMHFRVPPKCVKLTCPISVTSHLFHRALLLFHSMSSSSLVCHHHPLPVVIISRPSSPSPPCRHHSSPVVISPSLSSSSSSSHIPRRHPSSVITIPSLVIRPRHHTLPVIIVQTSPIPRSKAPAPARLSRAPPWKN